MKTARVLVSVVLLAWLVGLVGAWAQPPVAPVTAPVTAAGAPLSYPKGNGLRILSTGHSWVAPALGTLNPIATAAGYTGHHLLSHTAGSEKGSARSIWAAEQGGEDPGQSQTPRQAILLPALATGQWDVMTWGAYYWDRVEDYEPWIDACLKANPDMVFYIQDGWPLTKDFTTPAGEYDLEAMRVRQESIDALLAGLLHGLNAKYPGKVHVIPVGHGICRLVTLFQEHKLPYIKVVNSQGTALPGIYRDGGHLDDHQSGLGWFEGYIYYATLYRQPPAAIKASFKVPDAALDALYRQLAWEVVTQSPLSGVQRPDAVPVEGK